MIQETQLKIKGEDYQVWHEPDDATTYLKGILRLSGKPEYQPISDLLEAALEASKNITLNLCDLEFLNSSGITMLTMFVVKVRKKGDIDLTIKGSERILWQTKSLKNLQRLMPSLTLEFQS